MELLIIFNQVAIIKLMRTTFDTVFQDLDRDDLIVILKLLSPQIVFLPYFLGKNNAESTGANSYHLNKKLQN